MTQLFFESVLAFANPLRVTHRLGAARVSILEFAVVTLVGEQR